MQYQFYYMKLNTEQPPHKKKGNNKVSRNAVPQKGAEKIID